MEQLISFHGKQEIKDKYVARLKAHGEADEIIQGTGWQNGKGCAVGCTLHAYNHFGFEVELGIPYAIAVFEDRIFEALPNDEAKTFPLELLEAVPVGVNLDNVALEFSLWLLADKEEGVITTVTGENNISYVNKLIEVIASSTDGRRASEDDLK